MLNVLDIMATFSNIYIYIYIYIYVYIYIYIYIYITQQNCKSPLAPVKDDLNMTETLLKVENM